MDLITNISGKVQILRLNSGREILVAPGEQLGDELGEKLKVNLEAELRHNARRASLEKRGLLGLRPAPPPESKAKARAKAGPKAKAREEARARKGADR